MSNKYAGTCYRCGKTVKAGKGVLETVGRMQAKKWRAELLDYPEYRLPNYLVQHHNCAAFFRGSKVHHILAPYKGEFPENSA